MQATRQSLSFAATAAICLCGHTLTAAPDAITIKINLENVRSTVPPTLYGTGMEDVNHEIYGGLDAQRLYDESFEESAPPRRVKQKPNGNECDVVCGRQWADVSAGGGAAPLDGAVAHLGRSSQLLVPGNGTASVANSGLNGWGVPCRAGKRMRGHLFVRGTVGRLSVALQSADGRTVLAAADLSLPAGENWRKAEFALTPDRTDPAARFAITAAGPGRVWVDDAYLADEPTNEFGRLGCREDIVEGFRREGLTFLRWGGCMANALDYRWRNFRDDRRPYAGYWFKTSSTGFSYKDFVRLAAEMRLPCALSVLALESTEDAVAMAEWLKPFNIDVYIEIGNEECPAWPARTSGRCTLEGCRAYCANVRRIVPAMRKANPRLRFVSGQVFMPDKADIMDEAFRLVDECVDYWDLHLPADGPESVRETRKILSAFEMMRRRINPKSTMKIAVFEENSFIHGMKRALAHALNLEALREVGDRLLTSCPATALQPWGQNDNGWDEGQIFFTPDKVWLQPCAWAQRMASENHRDLLVDGVCDSDAVSVSATRDHAGRSVVLHLVNATDAQRRVAFDFGGRELRLRNVTSLASPRIDDDNPPDDPNRIAPADVTDAFRATSQLKPFSYTVVEFTNSL